MLLKEMVLGNGLFRHSSPPVLPLPTSSVPSLSYQSYPVFSLYPFLLPLTLPPFLNTARRSGGALQSSPAGLGRSPSDKTLFVHFQTEICETFVTGIINSYFTVHLPFQNKDNKIHVGATWGHGPHNVDAYGHQVVGHNGSLLTIFYW